MASDNYRFILHLDKEHREKLQDIALIEGSSMADVLRNMIDMRCNWPQDNPSPRAEKRRSARVVRRRVTKGQG